ncbi:MAG: type IX secretion system plug protein domain-containing protein [Bacteroidota bacterium]
MVFAPRVAVSLALVACAAGCALPEEALDAPDGPPPRAAAPGEWVVADDRLGAVQLHRTGEEASLPILPLEGAESLTLSFDLLGQEAGEPLDVTFVHTDRLGRETLLPPEYLTGFERDDIRDWERSSSVSAQPYVHYEYVFPNSVVGFSVSGNYRVVVSRSDGTTLLEAPFYITEQAADVELLFGSAIQGGSVGTSIQPAARLRPDARLGDFDASFYTVCFARDGLLEGLRCAPEPSVVDLALFQFYLPREDVFGPGAPLFEVDLGFLGLNTEVVDVDRSARPPTATLDLDYAEFGGDVRDPVLASVPLIEAAYDDVGQANVDAQYVSVRFRYVPPNGRPAGRSVHVRGSFNGWRATPASELTWVPAERRYEGEVLIKQGRYVYGFTPPPDRATTFGQPSLFTAFVYLSDPQRFTDRLVAVQSGIAR